MTNSIVYRGGSSPDWWNSSPADPYAWNAPLIPPTTTPATQMSTTAPVAQTSSISVDAQPSGSTPSSNGWGFLSTTDKNGQTNQGWGGLAIGAAQGLFNAWLGMKQYGLAKQQLSEGKREFQLNYDAQRSATNAQLADRQAARVASNPNAYQSVGDYMNTYGIKPSGG